jgi:hypothetical protein
MRLLIRQTIGYMLLLLSVLLVIGCSGKTYLSEVSIEAVEGSNRSAPVAVDLLFVSDSALMIELTSLSSPEWFAHKQKLMMRYQQISLASVEVVPLSVIPSVVLPDGYKNAKYIIMFANYKASAGQYVAELSGYQKLKIRLERDRYQLLEMNKE